MPTASIPIPPIAFSVSAPPLGHCSDVKPKIVGQQNVMPMPNTVAAAKMVPVPAWAVRESARMPSPARAEHVKSNPGGENLWISGPAQKRRINMSAEV